MKKIITGLLALTILVSSCQKSNNLAPDQSNASPDKPTPKPTSKPTASFKITNLYNNNGDILELRTLAFQNTSTNADSFNWDLSTGANYSDGIVDYPMQFSDKAEPANIYIAPCMQTITITLTAKNKAGDISTYSQSFFVQCFRGIGGRHPVMHMLY